MVYLFLADGFEEIEAVTPLDILRRAGVDAVTVGVGGEAVRGAHGITVRADITVDAAREDAQMLILPGGMPGAEHLQGSAEVAALLEKAYADGRYIAAICAAPKILGHMGLLRGKKAVCFPGYEDCLTGAEYTDKPVVIDGNIITSKGAGTAGDFGFALAGLLCGGDKADALRRQMLWR
jgi:4-methyl-5(b-hydroxyethyl)-thiazole monophosphate biosynthesis